MDDATSTALVSSGALAALISAIGAGVNLALRGRTRERLAALEGASDTIRAEVVEGAVAMFKVDAATLSAAQRYDLAVAQLKDRERQRTRNFWLLVVLMGVLAGTTITIALREGSAVAADITQPKPDEPSKNGDAPQQEPPPRIIQTSGDRGVNIVGSGNTVSREQAAEQTSP